MLKRRQVLAVGLAAPFTLHAEERASQRADARIAALLRAGGVVIALRHALAPGTFDPPGFKLGDCSTQRNLNEDGREQARLIGLWMRQQKLTPSPVRSSPWCRCIDTATLAFGRAEPWAALSSPTGAPDDQRQARQALLQAALKTVPFGRFEAWVTHQFVLADLAGTRTASGEALVLRATGSNGIEVLAKVMIEPA